MNLNKLISELQERNQNWYRYKSTGKTNYEVVGIVTADTAHAVALAVIEEIRKAGGIGWSVDDYLNHLTTLEAALQDNK